MFCGVLRVWLQTAMGAAVEHTPSRTGFWREQSSNHFGSMHAYIIYLKLHCPAGEYECPLIARGLPPRPQGPIDIAKAGGSIPFKNVFPAAAEFTYVVDNPAFSVRAGETLPAKKATAIAVVFKDAGTAVHTARLSVACPTRSATPWVFYLRAV